MEKNTCLVPFYISSKLFSDKFIEIKGALIRKGMYSEEKITGKDSLKKKKMNIGRTRRKKWDYFIYILVAAVIIQLALLVYRLAQL